MSNIAFLAAELRRNFNYDPETGLFTRIRASGGAKIGDVPSAGSEGYVRIRLCGKTFGAHRLAWLWVYGELPERDLDHINGIKSDNRITNLRDVSHAINTANLVGPQENNTSGYLGVTRHKGKWRAQISVDGKMRYVGLFASAEAAHQAYLDAKATHHPSAFLVTG